MRALAEVRDPWGLAIAVAAGMGALALTAPWPIALAAALAVVCVRVLAGLALSAPARSLAAPFPAGSASGPGGTLSPKELEVAQLHRKIDHLTERFEAATARARHTGTNTFTAS